MNIARTIYALRKENNLTQAQLAEKLGVSEQAVSKWENDQCAPDVSLFPLLADLFGVSIDRLFGYHEKSYDEGVEAIQREADDSRDTRKEIEILQAGLKRYPNSPDLKLYLAFSLSMLYRFSRDESERAQAVERAIGLCREVAFSRETKHADQAWSMLRRIYCEMGDFHAAEAAVNRISPDGYRQRIVGKAQILECRKDFAEHRRFTEDHLFECYLTMDQLFELKRIALLEQRDWAGLLAWSRAHEALLSVFDAGCDDFFLCHKFWACEAEARAYKGLGDVEGCRQAVSRLIDMASRMPADPATSSSEKRTSEPASSDGCNVASHTIAKPTQSPAHANESDSEGCRQAVSRPVAVVSSVPADSAPEHHSAASGASSRSTESEAPSEVSSYDFRIAVRNPLYFSTLTDPGIQEEFMTTPPLQPLLAPYAALLPEA